MKIITGLTAAELAAFLGVSSARIRQIIAAQQIEPVGHRWKAKLYQPADILRHAGTHDRRRVTA